MSDVTQEHRKKIGVGVATIIGMNAMIGAGIVSIPTILANVAGPAGILSYILSIVLVLFIGLSLSRLAELYPGAGWSYWYPSLWGGHMVGMISASCYVAGVVIAMGFLVQQVGIWLYSVLPVASASTLGIIMLLFLTLLVLAGATISSWGQYVIAACVVVPLLITGCICWAHASTEGMSSFMPYGPYSIIRATSMTLFSFLGFESSASLYSVVKDPSRNVPKATAYAIVAVGALYIFFAGSILFSIPLSYFSAGVNVPLGLVLRDVFPSYKVLPSLVVMGGLFALIGTIHSMIWSVSMLFNDVVMRARSQSITFLIKNNLWNSHSAVIVTSVSMLVMACIMKGEDLVNMAVLLIVLAFTSSITLLLFEKNEWRSGRNIRTLIAFVGSLGMLYVASLPVVHFLQGVFAFAN